MSKWLKWNQMFQCCHYYKLWRKKHCANIVSIWLIVAASDGRITSDLLLRSKNVYIFIVVNFHLANITRSYLAHIVTPLWAKLKPEKGRFDDRKVPQCCSDYSFMYLIQKWFKVVLIVITCRVMAEPESVLVCFSYDGIEICFLNKM